MRYLDEMRLLRGRSVHLKDILGQSVSLCLQNAPGTAMSFVIVDSFGLFAEHSDFREKAERKKSLACWSS